MTHAVATIPLAIIAGKDFGRSWRLREGRGGPVVDLAGIDAVEFRMSRLGLPEADTVIWSIASGHVAIVGDEMVLTVPGGETEDIPLGNWSWLLSYGASEAETPLVIGKLLVTAEP